MAKVILMGEHSVVYGYKAVAIPFKNKKVYVNVKKSNQFFKIKDKNLQYLVENICKILNKPMMFTLNIINEVPRSKGLGSSASFAIAIIKAIYRYYNKKIDNDLLYKIAKDYEDRIHLPSSGLDIITCINESPIIFSKNNKPIKFTFKLNLNLLIIDTKEIGHTKKAIELVRNNIEKNREILENISNLTEKFITYLKNENMLNRNIEIGTLFNKVNENLDKLNIVTDRAKKIINICNENNALGTKISGSGLGGIVISLVDDKNLDKILNILSKNKINIIGIEKI